MILQNKSINIDIKGCELISPNCVYVRLTTGLWYDILGTSDFKLFGTNIYLDRDKNNKEFFVVNGKRCDVGDYLVCHGNTCVIYTSREFKDCFICLDD